MKTHQDTPQSGNRSHSRAPPWGTETIKMWRRKQTRLLCTVGVKCLYLFYISSRWARDVQSFLSDHFNFLPRGCQMESNGLLLRISGASGQCGALCWLRNDMIQYFVFFILLHKLTITSSTTWALDSNMYVLLKICVSQPKESLISA